MKRDLISTGMAAYETMWGTIIPVFSFLDASGAFIAYDVKEKCYTLHHSSHVKKCVTYTGPLLTTTYHRHKKGDIVNGVVVVDTLPYVMYSITGVPYSAVVVYYHHMNTYGWAVDSKLKKGDYQ